MLGVWIPCVVGALACSLLNPEQSTPPQIAALLRRDDESSLLLFLVSSAVRAFVLLASTPPVIAGALLLPESPWAALGASLPGIALASTLTCHF